MKRFEMSPEVDQRDELSVCPKNDCKSDLVQPLEWAEASEEEWEILCQCPNCGWHGIGTHSDEKVAIFDETLERGTETLVRVERELTRQNMEVYIERFIGMLHEDRILPEDIGPSPL